MDLTSKQNIQLLLKKYGLKPQKKFGQNFLIDKKALAKVVEAAELTPQDTVLEIGPGIGTLTKELAQKAGKVMAIEKDRNMVEILKETVKEFKNVNVVQDDILRFDLPKLRLILGGRTSFKIVGNLPFYLTAPVIRMFLEYTQVAPVYMVLVVQKEMGQRICAQPPQMSILANAVQFYADPEIISIISKNSFWPRPEVDAAIIKIRNAKSEIRNNIDKDLFFKIMKAGFSHPRKQLVNNLANSLKMNREAVKNWLEKNNISPRQRAETLSVDDWRRLAVNY